ncbi:TIGR02679 domain-containing protein [Paenibacillus silvisoli]|uniref:TIGR02679 domain-containing protein n=1 Tax=Paenibacillus silvisoli TaxID=3110539 RepID=UPI0028043901|nr:TIGR02679 domain-containing protein [Paenibacillus silvisoli]
MRDKRDIDDRTIRYFSQFGFDRLLLSIWRRYVGLEKVGGHGIVRNATSEECEAINTFMGWDKKPGSTIKVPLPAFEKELRESVFPCSSIPELYELLEGKPLLTKSDKELLAAEGWQQLFSNVERLLAGCRLESTLQFWLNELQQGAKAAGYRMLRDLWRQSPVGAETELLIAVRAWMNRSVIAQQIGQSALRLPVLAAWVSGDSHALDRTTPAGRLLFRGLRFEQERRMRDGHLVKGYNLNDDDGAIDSLRVREIYRIAGILDDDLSSLVHIYDPEHESGAHPYVMTLRQVETAVETPRASDIFIVENPPVFSTLIDCTRLTLYGAQDENDCLRRLHTPLLICTSGPASAAAIKLFDRFTQDEAWDGKLYYSGDYDVKGLAIGNVLANRYPNHFVPWRFDTENYIQMATTVRTVSFSSEECDRLQESSVVWDLELNIVLRESGEKLFQEHLIPLLIQDWNHAQMF